VPSAEVASARACAHEFLRLACLLVPPRRQRLG